MPDPAPPPSSAIAPVHPYVAKVLGVLGSRDPLDVLREGPAALRQAVAGLSSEQLSAPEAADKWSVRQVVAHLADAELVVGFRVRRVLSEERPAIAGYDQDLWVERLRYQEADLETALGDFTTLRQGNLRLLERATPADLQREMLHSERGTETLAHLVRLSAGHDLIHLRQIARIRAAIGASPAGG